MYCRYLVVFFFQAEDGIRDIGVTGVQTCALPILTVSGEAPADATVESPAPQPVKGGRRGGLSRSARAREDRRTGYLLITPTVVIVGVMVVLPILWTVSLAFQQVRLLNLRTTGIIGEFDVDNFRNVLTSPGFV